MSTNPLPGGGGHGALSSSSTPSIPIRLVPSESKRLSENQSPTPVPIYHSSGHKKLISLLPIFLHVLAIAGTAIFMFMINGYQAFLSRPVSATSADGFVSFRTGYIIVQSDITTILSYLATIARTVGAWKASGVLWRCVFLFMERGRLSLKGVKRIMKGYPVFPKDLSNKRHFLLFSALLLVSFLLSYSSPVLTGSITWHPSFAHFRNDKPAILPTNAPGISLQPYRTNVVGLVATSIAMGDITWGTTGTRSTLLARVVPGVDGLPNQSQFQSLTIPYFSVDAFEWIQDPNSTLTTEQLTTLFDYNATYSPYGTPTGWLGLIPDQQWGPLSNANMTEPLTVSETRVLSLRTIPSLDNSGCDAATVPPDVGKYHHVVNGNDDCFVFARVTYRAGVAVCDQCATTSPAVLQRDRKALTLSADPLTAEALAILPYVGMHLMVTKWAVPPFDTTKDTAIEFLSRSYQSAWSSLTDALGQNRATDVQIAVPTTKAVVTVWRVGLWIGLHLIVVLAGLFSFMLNQSTSYPWLEDPAFAVWFLDAEELRSREVWEDDPWGSEDIPDVMLSLADGGSRRRRVIVHNPIEKA